MFEMARKSQNVLVAMVLPAYHISEWAPSRDVDPPSASYRNGIA
jgi:hypothetical protein